MLRVSCSLNALIVVCSLICSLTLEKLSQQGRVYWTFAREFAGAGPSGHISGIISKKV